MSRTQHCASCTCGSPPALSPQEYKVVQLLCTGALIKEISTEMGLNPNTVHTYIEHAYLKTGTRTHVSLVNYAYVTGLIPCPCMTVQDWEAP